MALIGYDLVVGMYHPTTRVLAVLELLLARGQMSGAELAQRLEVDRRTVRRYITMLQDLGIPVAAERGGTAPTACARGTSCPRCSSRRTRPWP